MNLHLLHHTWDVTYTGATVAVGFVSIGAATVADQINAYTGIGMMFGLIVVGVLNKLDARRAIKAGAKAAELAEVLKKAAEVAAKAAEIAAKVATDTHTLVNSNMGVQLKKAMMQSRRLAILEATPENQKEAAEDERLYGEHVARQAVVDSGVLTDKLRSTK